MLHRLFGRRLRPQNKNFEAQYAQIVAAARRPELFSLHGVPDTPLGRFEAIALHMVLYLRRLKKNGDRFDDIGRTVTEIFFREVDDALRELGIGDTSVPKRMKKLAKMFYGRAASYTAALDDGDKEALAAALKRNIMPDVEIWLQASGIAARMSDLAAHLDEQPDADIENGRLKLSRDIATTMTAGNRK